MKDNIQYIIELLQEIAFSHDPKESMVMFCSERDIDALKKYIVELEKLQSPKE